MPLLPKQTIYPSHAKKITESMDKYVSDNKTSYFRVYIRENTPSPYVFAKIHMASEKGEPLLLRNVTVEKIKKFFEEKGLDFGK